MNIYDYFKIMQQDNASDLYLSTNAPPSIKVHGHIKHIENTPLPPGRVKELATEILSEEQLADFNENPELNLAVSESGLGRFRVNVFQQRNEMAMVIRNITSEIPSIEDLGLPPIVKQLVMQKNGLLLFVGATSSGKSTSLASLIDYRNSETAGHIITIEDPIEFIHLNKCSIINQREVGIDTRSYGDALKNALRQAPDMILIGEIRAEDTMNYAISFSETGHLCVSTLHASNSNQALERIIHFFPENRREQLLLNLSLNFSGIVSQRLIPSLDGKRVLATEVLIGTTLVRDLIKRGEINALKEAMEKSETAGMHTFDSSLYDLYAAGKISEQEALRNADSPNNVRLRINLQKGVQSKEVDKFSLEKKEDETKTETENNGGQLHSGEFIAERAKRTD